MCVCVRERERGESLNVPILNVDTIVDATSGGSVPGVATVSASVFVCH